MLRYYWLAVLIFLAVPAFSQILKPDTLFFRQGRILPCKILDVSPDEITVLSEPSEPDYPWSYPLRKIAMVSSAGKRDSAQVFVNRMLEAMAVETAKNQEVTNRNSLALAGKMLSKAGNNLIFSNMLFIGSSLSMTWAITASNDDTRQMALVVAAGSGLLGLIMTFVGDAQLVKSGEMMMKISPSYSLSTRGTNLVFRF